MNFDQLQSWKSELGDAGSTATGPTKATLSNAYDAINRDRLNLVGSQDPIGDARTQLASIDSRYHDFLSFNKDTLKKLSDNNVTGGQIWNRISSGADPDANLVAKLNSNGVLGTDTQKAISAQMVREMSQNSQGVPNLATFNRNFRGMSDTAKQNIFGYDPDMLAQYNRLGSISQQMTDGRFPTKEALRFIPKSLLKGAGLLEGAAEAGGAEGLIHHIVANLGTSGAVAASVAAPYAFARLMVSKPFVNFLSKPVLNQDKYLAGLSQISRFHPELTGDINTLKDAGN
jgi:hypothetical protein